MNQSCDSVQTFVNDKVECCECHKSFDGFSSARQRERVSTRLEQYHGDVVILMGCSRPLPTDAGVRTDDFNEIRGGFPR